MSGRASKLREEVLKLPPEERADLAVELIASLDGDADEQVEEAWAAEVERRAVEVLSGKVDTSDWADVRRRIEQQVFKR